MSRYGWVVSFEVKLNYYINIIKFTLKFNNEANFVFCFHGLNFSKVYFLKRNWKLRINQERLNIHVEWQKVFGGIDLRKVGIRFTKRKIFFRLSWLTARRWQDSIRWKHFLENQKVYQSKLLLVGSCCYRSDNSLVDFHFLLHRIDLSYRNHSMCRDNFSNNNLVHCSRN